MRDNKGYSLVELVVVIAIIAIIGGAFAYTFVMVFNQQAKEGANGISLSLDKAKTYAMTKSGSSDAYLEISKASGGDYIVRQYVPVNPTSPSSTYELAEEEELCDKSVSIVCHMKDGSFYEITDTCKIKIYFDRVSGAYKKAVVDDGGAGKTEYCSKIEVKKNATYLLTLISSTGKHKLERTG